MIENRPAGLQEFGRCSLRQMLTSAVHAPTCATPGRRPWAVKIIVIYRLIHAQNARTAGRSRRGSAISQWVFRTVHERKAKGEESGAVVLQEEEADPQGKKVAGRVAPHSRVRDLGQSRSACIINTRVGG